MRRAGWVGWVLGLLVTLPPSASAGFADPATSYEDPCLVACPAGDSVFMMVVRNSGNIPWLYDDARLVFCDCQDFRLAPGTHDYYRALSGCEISKYPASDGSDGSVFFAVAGGGVCDAAGVYVAGIPFAPRAVASPDQNGDWLVTSADLALVQAKVGTNDRTADFDCDGSVTASDASIAAGHLGHGVGTTGVTPPRTPAVLAFSQPPAPNPARDRVRFTIAIPEPRDVEVAVRDLSGREVAQLWSGLLPVGEHGFAWNGATHAGQRARSGVYLVTLRSDATSIARRFALLR